MRGPPQAVGNNKSDNPMSQLCHFFIFTSPSAGFQTGLQTSRGPQRWAFCSLRRLYHPGIEQPVSNVRLVDERIHNAAMRGARSTRRTPVRYRPRPADRSGAFPHLRHK